jgi:hypothetical protein
MNNISKIVIVVAIGAAAHNYWSQHRTIDGSAFVSMPAVSGQSPSGILVIAAENCPHADSVRADQLANELSRSGLPVVRTNNISFDSAPSDRGDFDRMNAVMTGTLPIVFVRGRAKANPTIEEVITEFKGSASSK